MAGKAVKTIPATKPLYATQSRDYISRKKRVAAYARVSTDREEQETSFEAQVSHYTQVIRNNPQWEFVEVYADEGITGTSMKKRDGFNRMIEDALNGKIDLILTKSVSRFARNTVDSLTTVRKLKEKGVEVFFEKENIYTLDSKGELLITIMSSLAQEEARSISENTSWGRRKQFSDGKYSLAYSTFLGYDKGPNGELVINEEQAVVVRRIYDEYLAGKSPYMIAKGLTTEGIPTPAHKTVWQPSTVFNILQNEKYYGAAILQKTLTPDFLTKRSRKNQGELPMYYIAEDHEPIISPEKYQMVQEEIRRKKDAGGNARSISVFSGRVICGDCGGFYGRKVWHANTPHASMHWHCNNKFQKRQHCTTPTLSETDLQDAFVDVFNGLIRRKNEIERNHRRCLDSITDTSEYERQLEALNAGTAEIQKLIQTLLIENSKIASDESVLERISSFQSRLDTNARLKQELDMKIAACRAKRTQVQGFLAELKKHRKPVEKFDPII